MLAHLKTKGREPNTSADGSAEAPDQPESFSTAPLASASLEAQVQCPTTKLTCDALCSLSCAPPSSIQNCRFEFDSSDEKRCSKKGGMGCPKQEHQLPMFLSKTYHMIDRCDPSIATWSSSGDSFVVKSVERFATAVLPMYFKHSNFSSFARQLNFYGFRKLKAEPILTADFDAGTACYVRFYHDKFQKDRPELLAHIKRATKSDQQSKDDVEDLKMEINKMKDCINAMSSEYERRFTEMSYEYNRRITALSAEYDKLAVLMHQVLSSQSESPHTSFFVGSPAPAKSGVPDLMHSLSQVAAMSLHNSLRPPSLPAANSTDDSSHGYASRAKRSTDSDEVGSSASRPRLM